MTPHSSPLTGGSSRVMIAASNTETVSIAASHQRCAVMRRAVQGRAVMRLLFHSSRPPHRRRDCKFGRQTAAYRPNCSLDEATGRAHASRRIQRNVRRLSTSPMTSQSRSATATPGRGPRRRSARVPRSLGQEHRAHALRHPLEREQARDVLHPVGQLGELQVDARDELQHEHDRDDDGRRALAAAGHAPTGRSRAAPRWRCRARTPRRT